ncbi:MAG TPA: selenide, water dikinase SelD, partial [Dehalococcoidales bacterium]|nr:selenide, water dikinase SelD [Dehalococcoidales bacterium]
AANSLSDVYAMGGKPLTALNIVCFPKDAMDISVLRDALRGGLDMAHEAGVSIIGGHTVDDPELKYGLAVTGTIHPNKVVHNNTAKAGDKLILTKRLGTGVISTAIKRGTASKTAISAIVKSMTTLNKTASEVMLKIGVNACKDITGFGLLGHASEMIEGTKVGFTFNAKDVPVFPEAVEYARQGVVPGGTGRNREYRQKMVQIGKTVPSFMPDLLFDPQTSGGLLIAVPGEKAGKLLKALHAAGVEEAAVIGEVTAAPKGIIRVV